MQVTVCDICKDIQRPSKTYTVAVDGRSGTTDRCEEHAAPLEEIIEGQVRQAEAPMKRAKAAQPKPAKTAPAAPKGRRTRVVDYDEVVKARR